MTDTYIEKEVIKQFLNINNSHSKKPVFRIDDMVTFDKEGEVILDKNNEPLVFKKNIQLQNQMLERDGLEIWFETYYIPVFSTQKELGTYGRNRWTGIFQIDICVPKDSGTYDVLDIYDRIARHFRHGYIFNGIRVSKTERSSARMFDDFYSMPVSIYLTADLEN